MKIRIQHETSYRYVRPVTLQPHRLMLIPRGNHDLRLLASSVDCVPEAAFDWAQDVFGNIVATAAFPHPATELMIRSDMIVEQMAPAWPVFQIAPRAHAYPFTYTYSETADLGALLIPQHDDSTGQLRDWAKRFVLGSGTDTLALLKDMNSFILDVVGYRTRDEEGTQSPLDTLQLGSGSCRDIASLFIDAVRHLGFGARAISGYLFEPGPALGDNGSTHAWAEVYLPAAGWIAFDPTHRRVGSANLIPVAAGRCNAVIMPVTGGYVGAAEDFVSMGVKVSVTEA